MNNYLDETKVEKSSASKFLNILVKICLLPITVEGDIIKFKIWKAIIHILIYIGTFVTNGVILSIYANRNMSTNLIAADGIVELVAMGLSTTQYLCLFLLLGLSFEEQILWLHQRLTSIQFFQKRSLITKSDYCQLHDKPSTLINKENFIFPRKKFMFFIGFMLTNSFTVVDYFTSSLGLLNILNFMNNLYLRKF